MTTQFKIPTAHFTVCNQRQKTAIKTMMEKGCPDPVIARMEYDMFMAPRTTNRAQLSMCGIELPNEDLIADFQCEMIANKVRLCLLTVWNVQFIHTDHLEPRELYRRISASIDDLVPDVAPDPGVWEYIDLTNPMHPEMEQEFLRHYASENERNDYRSRTGNEPPACIVPKYTRDAEFADIMKKICTP
jgi:hypothetical protein